MDKNFSNEFIIERSLAYQEGLIGRRWQGLLAYLIMNGFLLNAISGVGNEKSILLLSFVAIFLGMLLIRFVHITAVRLENIQIRLIEEYQFSLIEIPLDGKLTINSVTTIIYLTILALSFVWIVKIYNTDKIAFIVAITIIFTNLATIRWKPPLRQIKPQ